MIVAMFILPDPDGRFVGNNGGRSVKYAKNDLHFRI